MLDLWKMKSVRIVTIVAVLVGLYALAGFVIAPKLIRSALIKDIPENIDANASVGEIHLNPFLMQVTIDKFALTGKNGDKLLGFDRLFVDFDLSSIWHRAYTFGRINLDAPWVNATVAQNGTLNLMQLQPKAPSTPPPPKKNDGLPALRIGTFKVSQGQVAYEDHSHPDVFAARLQPLDFELRDFTTGVEGGKFTFSGATKLGERIEWHGHLSVQPIESDGEFRIDGLLVHTLWEYLEDKLNFVVNSGTIDVAATYKFTAGDSQNLNVDLSNVSLTHLTVRPKGGDADWITVPSFKVTGTTVDLAKRQAHVDLVSLDGLKLLGWLEPDGTVNLLKLGATAPGGGKPSGPAPPTVAVTPAASAPAAPAPAWVYDVRQFELRDASIAAEDRTQHPAVKVLLAPFSVQVNGISQDLGKPLTVKLDTHINQSGTLAVGGEVTPQPVAANLTLKAADIDLEAIQPYLGQHTSMTLRHGLLGMDGKLHYGTAKDSPKVLFTGNIVVDKLNTVDNALHEDFVNWERLDVQGLSFSQSPDRLDIEQITARKPYARVVIAPDSSLNVSRVLAAPGSAAARPVVATTETAVGPVAVPAEKPAVGKPTAETPATAKPTAKKSRKARPAGKAAEAAPDGKTPAMPMAIKKIVVQGGQAKFADLSVKPNFATGIQDLGGTIMGLSSKAGSRAKVDLKGSIGTYSPVVIAGEFNVLGPKLYTDMSLGFHNIELTIFNPYSGKFAGYNISKGKLSTDLHYKVDGRQLDAQHHIVVDQLEFGDKTASKDAVSLPVKLAVSLLKDRNGVIDLNLPVTGSLDDPKFRLAPIIWKVLVNILEKAITAPFALLGSLFGGGPDLQFVDFKPGVDQLDAAGTERVKTVAKALAERPQLKIEVPIAVVPDLDRPALVAARFDAEVSASLAAKGAKKKSAAGAAAPAFGELDPAGQLAVLQPLYAKDFGAEPKFPDSVTGLKNKPDVIAAKVDFLSKAIHDHIQVGDAELQALGQQRAQSLQQVLLADSQVTAERVFLVANDKATAKDGAVRLELTLQ